MKKTRKFLRSCALFLAVNLLAQLGLPTVSWALTGGPSQPETQQFSPAGMDNMVDPFTGDFSYNIPLMDVGGYPVNINYAAGVTPDQEASWVGLGWNLNVGAINRSHRGLPDDFAGDEVEKKYNIKPNQTFGIRYNSSNNPLTKKELWGIGLKFGATYDFFYNTYNGFGMSKGSNIGLSFASKSKPALGANLGVSASLGSESGVDVAPTLGLSFTKQAREGQFGLGTQIGFPFNSREGLKGMSLSGSFDYSATKNVKVPKANPGEGDKTMDVEAGRGTGTSSSAFKGFAVPTYTPSLDNDSYSINLSLDIGGGSSNAGVETKSIAITGYYSGQFLNSTSSSTPAYGYLYSGNSNSGAKLMDFNREKDGGFNKYTTNLAVTNFTYDIFSASAEGMSGSYRLHRGDVGSVHDREVRESHKSFDMGVAIHGGGPPSVKVGGDFAANFNDNYTGKWQSGWGAIPSFLQPSVALDAPNVEPAYFKKMGEMTPENDANFIINGQKGYNTVQNKVLQAPDVGGVLSGQMYGTANPDELVPNAIKSVRKLRNSSFVTLTAAEAVKNNILPISSYDRSFTFIGKAANSVMQPNAANSNYGYSKSEPISRLAEGKKAHHISEIRVTNDGGTRYIYGIPVYNKEQYEVSFSVNPASQTDADKGLVYYTPDEDNSTGNKKGLDHFFSRTSTPPYATSYLLTTILSTDYVDSDGVPGPSQGDRGTYTKFNYTRHTDDFKWRTPYQKANYSENLLGKETDDMGNYLYGKKELWYLHSIETRTHVAEFYLSDRKDAKGVQDENGGRGSVAQQKLDKIVLYSLKDKENGVSEPLKTVYFQYDPEYPLCKQVDNNTEAGKGKLTLRKIWFTYGNSKKGVLNPYVFNYSPINPDYSLMNYDRWGNYKRNGVDGMTNKVFPYANQNKQQADEDASAYNLSSINTPTGGTVKVFYESDDYAYVQNRRAMRMFKIVGVSYKDANTIAYEGENELIVDIGDYTPSGSDDAQQQASFRKDFLEGINLVYFKVKVSVLSDTKDIVPGYGQVNVGESKYLGTAVSSPVQGHHYASIRLNRTGVSSSDIHPITKSAWMFARLHYSRELMGSANAEDNGVMQILGSMVSSFTSVLDLLRGYANAMKGKSSGKYLDLGESFLRLNEPDKIKLGGGHRVKAIVMSDNWDLMTSSINSSTTVKQRSYYGQSYAYTMEQDGKTISSGVAAFEPALGNEENPFRLPVYRTEPVPMAPSKEYFLEEPFGESFFPAPTVGYQKVVVTPLKIQQSTDNALNTAIANYKPNTVPTTTSLLPGSPIPVTGNGTGKVEHEFYTAYDFPTITNRTGIDAKYYQPSTILKLLKYNTATGVTATQGYYVETNDMHGKAKAQRVYPEVTIKDGKIVENKPISEVTYFYKNDGEGHLTSRVPLVTSDLKVLPVNHPSNGDMGVDIDMVQDQRSSQSLAQGGGIQINFKWVQAAVFPIVGVVPLPTVNKESSQFRSLVTTKTVNRLGILEKTIAKDNGASITTENIAYDAKTGQVLLTKVNNEYNDTIFNFTIPGHMAYPRMDMASLKEGAVYSSGNNANIQDGDELATTQGTYTYVEAATPHLLNNQGTAIGGGASSFKVIRSGARNMQSTPIGSISLLENPIQADNTLSFTNKRILNAGATEFKEDWNRFCNCPVTIETALNANKNTFAKGLRGNLRPLKSWTYLSNRTQTGLNNNLNIRTDGTFEDFVNFWTANGGKLVRLQDQELKNSKWQSVTEITNYNPLGMEIENVDALGRYSMAQFGYGRNLPVATSNNSKYRSTGYDGFEDYDYKDCQDDHFGFSSVTEVKDKLSTQESHTGRKSIKIPAGGNVKISKVIQECGTAPSGN